MTRTSFERNRKSMSDPLAVAAMSGLRLRGLTLYGRHSSRIGQTSPPYLIAKRIRAETNQIDDTVKPKRPLGAGEPAIGPASRWPTRTHV